MHSNNLCNSHSEGNHNKYRNLVKQGSNGNKVLLILCRLRMMMYSLPLRFMIFFFLQTMLTNALFQTLGT
jgi:hypothetical protein